MPSESSSDLDPLVALTSLGPITMSAVYIRIGTRSCQKADISIFIEIQSSCCFPVFETAVRSLALRRIYKSEIDRERERILIANSSLLKSNRDQKEEGCCGMGRLSVRTQLGAAIREFRPKRNSVPGACAKEVKRKKECPTRERSYLDSRKHRAGSNAPEYLDSDGVG